MVGLTGIIMIFGEHISEFSRPEYLLGIVMIIVAIISWAFGSIWIKKPARLKRLGASQSPRPLAFGVSTRKKAPGRPANRRRAAAASRATTRPATLLRPKARIAA
jgi:hypothetical protein